MHKVVQSASSSLENSEIDSDWYLATYPEVSALGMTASQHYKLIGNRLGYSVKASQCISSSVVNQNTFSGSIDPAHLCNANQNAESIEGKRRYRSLGIRRLTGKNHLLMQHEDYDGFSKWSSTEYDPQMELYFAGEDSKVTLLPGRYVITVQMECIDGHIKNPKLYFDFGSGYAEAPGFAVPLEHMEVFGEYHAAFDVNDPIKCIRFDPSDAQFSAYVKAIRLEQFEETYSDAPISLPPESRVAYADGVPEKPNAFKWGWEASFGAANGSWRAAEFAPLVQNCLPPIDRAPKAIAFYLPQFHPIDENDKWWGKGFTEWTNVSKAVPQFIGHYQPRLPGELGFYDLRLPEVMARQIELAKQYGIHAFCFHYYWFDGHRMLEKPIEAFLANKSPAYDFPFCLCWANENWTRRWDGGDDDILMGQKHSEEDHLKVFNDLMRFFKDSRYIKIDNKPVIVIYRPMIIDKLNAMVKIWREQAITAGFDGVYLIATNSFGFNDPGSIEFDGICEFPPHGLVVDTVNDELLYLNKDHSGYVFENKGAIEYSLGHLAKIQGQGVGQTYYPGVMAGWDNEARKPGRGNVFHGSKPSEFYRWFSGALDFSMDCHEAGKGIVFINAWNEWAEGTYLEPDRKFGYGYLSAVAAGLRRYFQVPQDVASFVQTYNASAVPKSSNGVVCAHVFYEDLAKDISSVLEDARSAYPLDLMLTLPETWTLDQIEHALNVLKPNFVKLVKNVGRDVWPFLELLKEVRQRGYEFGCKIHSKKSPHLTTGDRWRRDLYNSLLDPAVVDNVRSRFNTEPKLGMIAPGSSISGFENNHTLQDNIKNIEQILGAFDLSLPENGKFVAGTMFWFRCKAFDTMLGKGWTETDFGPELGAIDGTVAHAFERVFPLLIGMDGFELQSYLSDRNLNPYS